MEETPIKPMPRTLVLNYMARGSISRTWETATAVLYAAAVVALLLSVILLCYAASVSYHRAKWSYSLPSGGTPVIFTTPPTTSTSGPTTSITTFTYSYSYSLPPVTIPRWLEEFVVTEESWWGTGLFGLGTGYLISAIGLQRGSRRAARFATWIFVPVILALVTISSMLICAGTVNLFGLYGLHEQSLSLLLIPGFLCLVVTLLAFDVHRMLRWAARNPLGELEKRPFSILKI